MKVTPEQEFDALVRLTAGLLASGHYTEEGGDYIRVQIGKREFAAAVQHASLLCEDIKDEAGFIFPSPYDEPDTLIPPPWEPPPCEPENATGSASDGSEPDGSGKLSPADPSGSLSVAEAEAEADAWEWFCGAHPHEAHAKDPDRFWERFRKACPGFTREQMMGFLEETAEREAGEAGREKEGCK